MNTKPIYKFLAAILKAVYPKIEAVGAENIPNEPVIIVGNHCQLHGPIACEFYSPVKRRTWVAGATTNYKECPSYAYEDFWSQKPKYQLPFFKVISYVVTPLLVLINTNAETIPVYRDKRIFSTFKRTVSCLEGGDSIVIFPEHDKKHNNIVYDFQDKFIDVARLYHKKTGKELSFVPLYIAPKMKKMYYGKPIRFNASAPIDEERERIRAYLMSEITDTAVSLELHTVVPYRNIPKKYYPLNKEADNEKARC